MHKSLYSEEKIIKNVREAEAGKRVVEVCRRIET
jgi:hypothetical protein